MQPLPENQIEAFSWPSLPPLVRLGTPPGNSYFSAILSALSTSYISGRLGSLPVDRKGLLENAKREKLEVNIFILERGEVAVEKDFNYAFPSLVLLKFPNQREEEAAHYELVGINERGFGFPNMKTLFPPDHPFLLDLRKAVTV